MFVVIVQAHIKQEMIQSFIEVTLDNAVNSNLEPGIERFDFYQQEGDPSRFALIEIYRSEDAPEKHRETSHYKHWRDTIESMMVEPRTKITYKIIYQKSGEG